MHKRIKDLINGILDELAAAGTLWRAEPITHRVLQRFEGALALAPPGPIGEEGRDFWRHCGFRTVRGMVGAAIGRRTDPMKTTADQPVFDGFPRVQAYYEIERDGEWVGVPVLQLRAAERAAKISELRTAGEALLEHAEQLELFFEQAP